MNYLVKHIRNTRNYQKFSIDFNSKPKQRQISFFSLSFKSNLNNLNNNFVNPPMNIINNTNKIFLKRKYTQENKNNDVFDTYNDKSNSNLTSTGINNKTNIIRKSKKKIYICSPKSLPNQNYETNISNNNTKNNKNHLICKKKGNSFSLVKIENQNNKEISKNNDNQISKRCRHKQVKREININNKNNQNQKSNVSGYKSKRKEYRNSGKKILEAKQDSKEMKNNSITILIKKRIKDNFFIREKKNKSSMDHFLFDNKMNSMQKTIKKQTFINNKNKENNENLEISDINFDHLKRSTFDCKFNRIIDSPKCNLNKKKNESIMKYINYGVKTFENRFHKNRKEKRISLDSGKCKKTDNNDICFNEKELNENTLEINNGRYIENKQCGIMINRVLNFETGINGIFNQFKISKPNMNDNKMSFLNKNHSTKNMKEKKESCSTVISSGMNNYDKDINQEEDGDIKNIENIIKINLDYNINKKKNLRKNCDSLYFQKDNTYAFINHLITHKNTNKLIQNHKKAENTIMHQDCFASEKNTNSLTINGEFSGRRKRFKSLNLNIPSLKSRSLVQRKYLFYKILESDTFLKLFLSFGDKDIELVNKMSLLSKTIYKKIKPFIYEKISELIYKYSRDKNTKNKIKKYTMIKNSPFLKISPVILRKKYTDLVFENNNKYDTEIKKDLTRTFPDNILFKYGNEYYNKLYHILTAYSNFNKNIGYVQGLNFLSAHIIYFFEDEIDEFTFLDALIQKFDLDKILDKNCKNNKFYEKKLENLCSLIIKQIPTLHIFLVDLKLNLDFFLTSWILTLFSDSMENQFLSIVWDYMLIFGWKFFNYFILNILTLFEKDILNSKQNNLTYLKKNMLRNDKFKNNFRKLIKDTMQKCINDISII